VRRSLTRRLLSIGQSDVGGGRSSATEVTVRRVPWKSTYARVSTVGRTGDRAFVLVPGIGVSSNYFERLAGSTTTGRCTLTYPASVLALPAYALCGVRWFSRVLPEMVQYPIEDVLPKVTANTLVISGSEDDLCPREWINQVADLLPSCRVSIIPGAAHSIMHAHADVVAQLSVEHVRRPGTEPLALPDGGSDAEEYPAGLGQVTGQVTELVGIATDDDTLIAEGKTAQAEAVERLSDDDDRHLENAEGADRDTSTPDPAETDPAGTDRAAAGGDHRLTAQTGGELRDRATRWDRASRADVS